ncbi:DUF3192 domain-containing protein [Colwellia sp. 1_MG-2023]|uniref:DUF3192 domain-containing protein n=1 Tax=Colwellia sp. 1_MG-2023 TaxID=3062649 RepID=UPI0026E1D257|nr:DUF3192 domain-containing protein [Colwellia sp. 1_MG-2023]MDO6446428.1 DUF3192 domain-containing protein [Colwellia sp. 1_MG-2023]
MKKSILALIIAAPLALSLTGCVVSVGGDDGHNMTSDFENREYTNRKKISRIALKSSIVDVTNRLGVADFNETYEKEGDTVRVLFYRTNRIHKDGLTTRDECTYLYFVNGELVETGQGGDFSRNISR